MMCVSHATYIYPKIPQIKKETQLLRQSKVHLLEISYIMLLSQYYIIQLALKQVRQDFKSKYKIILL